MLAKTNELPKIKVRIPASTHQGLPCIEGWQTACGAEGQAVGVDRSSNVCVKIQSGGFKPPDSLHFELFMI